MKIYIGPYKNWFGPYQLAEKILFWKDKDKDDSVSNLGEWLAYGKVLPKKKEDEPALTLADTIEKLNERREHETLLFKFLSWIESKRKRTIVVKIDKYDTWSMDHTLSYIIVPMLKQLKETKHGAPYVDNKDVPKDLHSSSAPPKVNSWDVDANHFKRWDWVLDEMIWAFEQHANDDKDQPPYTDEEEYIKYLKRKQKGFALFGKYYQSLWD